MEDGDLVLEGVQMPSGGVISHLANPAFRIIITVPCLLIFSFKPRRSELFRQAFVSASLDHNLWSCFRYLIIMLLDRILSLRITEILLIFCIDLIAYRIKYFQLFIRFFDFAEVLGSVSAGICNNVFGMNAK